MTIFTGTGTVILTGFKCTDRDGDSLTFNLATNPDDGSFKIDSVKEELKVIGEYNIFDKICCFIYTGCKPSNIAKNVYSTLRMNFAELTTTNDNVIQVYWIIGKSRFTACQ